MYQNYPNPFNASTNIQFRNPKKEFVTLKIFNILGEEVETLVAGQLVAGFHSFEFRASNLPSGVYIYRLEVPSPSSGYTFVQTRKMLLIR